MGRSEGLMVINGPSLGELGRREPGLYGGSTLPELEDMVRERAGSAGIEVAMFQSDIEGEIVREINSASGRFAGLLINPGAYSHYSIAILDAMRAFEGPVAEVHLSRVFSREPFRRSLVTAEAADFFIAGAGVRGYLCAVDLLLHSTGKDGGVPLADQQ